GPVVSLGEDVIVAGLVLAGLGGGLEPSGLVLPAVGAAAAAAIAAGAHVSAAILHRRRYR
ncbi:MAG: hypothetical protein ABMB14_06480, partial [Myxococcota bacterium]